MLTVNGCMGSSHNRYCVCSGGQELVRAYKHGRAFADSKGVPCLLSISRLPRSHQVGRTLEEEDEEEELTGEQASLLEGQLQNYNSQQHDMMQALPACLPNRLQCGCSKSSLHR